MDLFSTPCHSNPTYRSALNIDGEQRVAPGSDGDNA